MKPQRFRSLRGARVLKIKPPHPAIIAAAGFLIFFFALCNLCRAEDVSDTFNSGNEQCQSRMASAKSSIYTDDTAQTLKPEYDPEHNCSLNKGDETSSHNAAALDLVPEALKLRAAFTGDHKSVKDQGACRLAYESVKNVFDAMAKRQTQFCRDFGSAHQDAMGCGHMDDASCKPKWSTYRDVSQRYADDLQRKGQTALDYLDSFIKATQKAHDRYQHDLDRLRAEVQQRQQDGTNGPMGPSLASAPDVKPTNGNRDSQTFEDYLKMLDAPSTQTTLIMEEDHAFQNLKTFRGTIKSDIEHYQGVANEAAKSATSALALADKSSSMNKDSTITDKVKKISDVGGAAEGAEKLLGQGGDKDSGSGGEKDSGGGSSSSSGSSSSASPAAALAAAGLGAAAAHGADSGASQAPPASSSGQAAAPAAPSVSSFGDNATAGGPSGKSSGHGSGGAADANNAGGGKTDAATAKADEPGVNPGFTGSYTPSGDGASRPGGSGKRAPAAGASGAPLEAGGAGTGEVPNAFSGNLDARPAAKAPTANTGSEVANLLGQMKNLFNFDESAGLPGGGGATPFGPGPAGGMAPMDPSAPGAALGTPEAQTAEVAAVPGEPEAMAASTAPGIHVSEELQSNPYGKTDVTLFARVRARHRRCMERGLVLYGLKERIQ